MRALLALSGVFIALGAACSDDAEGDAGQSGAGEGGESASGTGGGGHAGHVGAAGSSGARAAGSGGTGRAGAGNAGTTSGRSGGGSAGSGGASGRSGAGGMTGSGGTSGASGGASGAGAGGEGGAPATGACNPGFVAANKCNPQVTYANDEANGDGAMFDAVIDDPIATIKDIACQVCTILYRNPNEVKRNPASIRLHIYDFDGVANAGGGTLNFSTRHIANYDDPEDARFEFLGVLIHEITHFYQNDDGGGALVEGMADFVRIRAGHHRMNRRTPGGAWTDAYTTSGFFFSWLAGPGGLQEDGREPADPDIGWAINQRMDGNWSEAVFMDRLSQDVNTLWSDYQEAIR